MAEKVAQSAEPSDHGKLLKEGTLLKKSPAMFKGYQVRHFKLYEKGIAYSKPDAWSPQSKQIIKLATISSIEGQPPWKDFAVVVKNRKYLLRSGAAEDGKAWYDAITEAFNKERMQSSKSFLGAPNVQPPGATATLKTQEYPAGSCCLRFITVNDVYELHNLANFATCKREKATANTFCILAGDFIAPSLLSSLDKGKGMVDILNRAGFDYVCFGNHEADISHHQLLKRIQESKFTWVNTNMQRLPMEGNPTLPDYVKLEVSDGGQKRKVALLGLNTEDASAYKSSAWGGLGAGCIDPILPVAKDFQKKLLDPKSKDGKFDLVVPMTHQLMTLDRAMAKDMTKMPLIIGGHDHDEYYEVVEGTHISKMGAEAKKIGIIDVVWPGASTPGTEPTVYRLSLDASSFTPDAEIKKAIAEHLKVLEVLDKAELCPITPDLVGKLTSVGARESQVTMGTFVCNVLRDALHCDCCCITGGHVRGNCGYGPEKTSLTYRDLKVQLPYDNEVVDARLPGRIINDMVVYSRSFAIKDPPPKKMPGCFLQMDDRMTFDDTARAVTHINGQPLDPDKIYEVACLYEPLVGMDNITPLVDYCKAHPKEMPDPDSGRSSKEIIVSYFAKRMWWDILKNSDHTFCSIDDDGNGWLSMDELQVVVTKTHGQDVASLVVENLFLIADKSCQGKIKSKDALRVCVLSQCGRNEFSNLTLDSLKQIAKDVLGKAYRDEEVAGLFQEIDKDGSGCIDKKQIKQYKRRASQLISPMI